MSTSLSIKVSSGWSVCVDGRPVVAAGPAFEAEGTPEEVCARIVGALLAKAAPLLAADERPRLTPKKKKGARS